MEPLTMEELSAWRAKAEAAIQAKEGDDAVVFRDSYNQYIASVRSPATVLRLIAAAERSIRRPIATAPRDGTMIFGCDKYGNWHVCNWLGDVEGEIGQWFDQQSWDRDLVAWLPITGEGGV